MASILWHFAIPTHVVPGPDAETLATLPSPLRDVAELQVSLGAGQHAAGILLRMLGDVGPWWRSLTPAERLDCHFLFPRRVSSFLESLQDLDDENDPEDEGWQAEVLDLCEQYDLLIGWGQLLSHVGGVGARPTRTQGLLSDMSAAMERMLYSLYMELDWESRDHLAEVARLDTLAWWARPGAPYGARPRGQVSPSVEHEGPTDDEIADAFGNEKHR